MTDTINDPVVSHQSLVMRSRPIGINWSGLRHIVANQ